MIAQAATISYPDSSTAESKWGIVIFHFDANDANSADSNSVSKTSGVVYGKIDRITINSTGTDKKWGVRLKDSLGIPLFTKTDCNSLQVPYGYAVTQPDGRGSTYNYRGISVFGPLTCSISDVDYSAEIQTISILTSGVTPDAGYYTISYGGKTTGHIPYGATTATIDANLETLSTIGTGNIQAVAATALAYGHNIVLTGTGNLAKKDLSPFTIDTSHLLDIGNGEQQTLAVTNSGFTADAGYYTIAYNGQTTNHIAYNATATAIEANLIALSTIGPNNVSVTATNPLGYGHDVVLTFVPHADINAVTVNAANLIKSGNNEIQTIHRIGNLPTSGHWHITYNTVKTGAIAYNAGKAAIDANLNAAFGTGKIVSTAAGGINANDVILTFSGTGESKKDCNAVTLDLTALLDANSAAVTATVTETTKGVPDTTPTVTITETVKGKADVIPTATVTETNKGGNKLNLIDITAYYFKGD
jgi:hypothetical protein